MCLFTSCTYIEINSKRRKEKKSSSLSSNHSSSYSSRSNIDIATYGLKARRRIMDEHKLFVGNMAARITQRDLWRFFSPYGVIDECAKFHESYAFVRYVHADDAQRARRETHGAILKGRKLKVEFAATVNKTHPAASNQSSKHFLCFSEEFFRIYSEYLYIQPLRRSIHVPACFSQAIPSGENNERKFSPESSDKEEWLTPDLLRLAGIQFSSPDDGYETNSSSLLSTSSDSRFFPISNNRHHDCSTAVSHQANDSSSRLDDLHRLCFDFTRIRLFSNGSSSCGDDSSLYVE